MATIEGRLTECADWVWRGEDDLHGVPAAARMLREAAEVIAGMRAALEAVEAWWLEQGRHQCGGGVPYAIFAARAALERAGRDDDGDQ